MGKVTGIVVTKKTPKIKDILGESLILHSEATHFGCDF
jgi:hypothetical protein